MHLIGDIPKHATLRGKDSVTGLVGQAWNFPLFVIGQTLTYCMFQSINIFTKFEYEESSIKHWLSPGVNLLEMHVSNIFVK